MMSASPTGGVGALVGAGVGTGVDRLPLPQMSHPVFVTLPSLSQLMAVPVCTTTSCGLSEGSEPEYDTPAMVRGSYRFSVSKARTSNCVASSTVMEHVSRVPYFSGKFGLWMHCPFSTAAPGPLMTLKTGPLAVGGGVGRGAPSPRYSTVKLAV